MLKQFTHVNVWVHDQTEALAFHTDKLGMEVREDVTVASDPSGNQILMVLRTDGGPS